jgi:tetratricopeptide (TPR) repeat protein
MILEQARGNREETERAAVRILQLSETRGSRFGIVQALQNLGACHTAAGRYEEAVSALERSLEIARTSRAFLHAENLIRARLARACLGAGQRERARRITESLRVEEDPVVVRRGALAPLLVELCDPGDAGDVEAFLDQAEAHLERTGFREPLPSLKEARARLAQRRGDEEGRDRHLREAWRLYTEMGATGHAERLARELGRAQASADPGSRVPGGRD